MNTTNHGVFLATLLPCIVQPCASKVSVRLWRQPRFSTIHSSGHIVVLVCAIILSTLKGSPLTCAIAQYRSLFSPHTPCHARSMNKLSGDVMAHSDLHRAPKQWCTSFPELLPFFSGVHFLLFKKNVIGNKWNEITHKCGRYISLKFARYTGHTYGLDISFWGTVPFRSVKELPKYK